MEDNMWMWCIATAAFTTGWYLRGMATKKKSSPTPEPEMMWFNDNKSRWERVTTMELKVGEQAVVTVPVKLTQGRK